MVPLICGLKIYVENVFLTLRGKAKEHLAFFSCRTGLMMVHASIHSISSDAVRRDRVNLGPLLRRDRSNQMDDPSGIVHLNASISSKTWNIGGMVSISNGVKEDIYQSRSFSVHATWRHLSFYNAMRICSVQSFRKN